jgi:hypothetical protein
MQENRLFMKAKLRDWSWLILVMIGVYAMLFEWRSIFERPYFIFTANLLKFIIPVVFFLFILRTKRSSEHPIFWPYIVFFILFIVWGLISSLYSPELNECIVQWLKYVLLFFFCYFICSYMLKSKYAIEMAMKFFIVIAVFTVIQYIILTVATFCGPVEIFHNPTHSGGLYRGPFGILGQGSGRVWFNDQKLSFFQLYGFWKEPSNVVGFLLASYFFAEIVFLQTKQRIWKIAKFACLIGCIATFSNTAYLCMGIVGLCGEVFWLKTSKNRRFFHLSMVLIFVSISFTAIFGRYIVAKYCADNIELRYAVGVRDAVKNPYGGRAELFKSNLADLKVNPLLGIGIRIPGKDEQGRGYAISSNALGYWLTFTGIIGIMLLMLRELQIIKVIAKNMFSSVYILRVSQAWIALFISNFIYGTLMSPVYFIMVAIVFSSIYYFNKSGNIE